MRRADSEWMTMGGVGREDIGSAGEIVRPFLQGLNEGGQARIWECM
jgi:hypothetical protein